MRPPWCCRRCCCRRCWEEDPGLTSQEEVRARARKTWGDPGAELVDQELQAGVSLTEIRAPRFRGGPAGLDPEAGGCDADNADGPEVCQSDSFESCVSEEAIDQLAAVGGSFLPRSPRKASAASAAAHARRPAERVRAARQNRNVVTSYRWTQELLELIVHGRAPGASMDAATQRRATPLFVVAGACPNTFCGMQAVLYCYFEDPPGVDFWWVKPLKGSPGRSDHDTWNLHSSGKLKNSAGAKARAVYQPFADKFAGCTDVDFAYGVDDTGRAYIDEIADGAGRARMFVYLVWQESWSSPTARSNRFLQGKLCYQRRADPAGAGPAGVEGGGLPRPGEFYARQYRIQDGRLIIASSRDEEPLPALLPEDPSFQEMYDMSNCR